MVVGQPCLVGDVSVVGGVVVVPACVLQCMSDMHRETHTCWLLAAIPPPLHSLLHLGLDSVHTYECLLLDVQQTPLCLPFPPAHVLGYLHVCMEGANVFAVG